MENTNTTENKPNTGFPQQIIDILKRPLPSKAIAAGTRGLSSIKAIYLSERLNEAFGEGRWFTTDTIVERVTSKKTKEGDVFSTLVVVKVKLHLLDYPWFQGEAYGGNDNADLGDAYKGSVSDATSKILATQLSVAVDVYKGQGEAVSKEFEKQQALKDSKDSKDSKELKEQKAAQDQQDRQTVSDPPACDDCVANGKTGDDAKIKTYKTQVPDKQNPGKKLDKVYDAADLVKSSQKKYQKNLCADCQTKRAADLKNQASRGPQGQAAA